MSREIKFRVWDDWTKQMLPVLSIDFKETYSSERGTQVLMQYIGLKDKNGKEIFEGDIVAQFNFEDKNFRVKVVYENGAFGYKYPGPFNEFISYDLNTNFKWENGKSEKIEVLGNVYTTPELLKEGE